VDGSFFSFFRNSNKLYVYVCRSVVECKNELKRGSKSLSFFIPFRREKDLVYCRMSKKRANRGGGEECEFLFFSICTFVYFSVATMHT
jgi:hypothetical protein